MQNQWYTVLDEDLAKIFIMATFQENDDLANIDTEVRITIDDNPPITRARPAHANSTYIWWWLTAEITAELNSFTTFLNACHDTAFESHHVKIEIRQTSVINVNQRFDGLVRWAKLQRVVF